ncbi:DUF7691 family protein [Streptomyces sp. NPDC001222]|uniref:DUF7691 family protein n=1 Tax=Streptomyces sp. NPDC001222 TaxID=3364548 RepID=UPI0036C4EA39
MSHGLEMSTGDMRSVMRLLTAVERTPEQERMLGIVRERCARTDARLQEQDIDLGVSVGRALDELLEGAPSVEVSPAYTYAFHELVACHFSETVDLGSWRRLSWFHSVDDELARHGVPSELRPGSYLFSGPPVRLPHPGDIVPQIGVLAAQRAAAVAEAYVAVLDRLDPDHQGTVRRFAEVLQFEAEEWESARELGQTNDTIFFWFR